MTDDNLKKLYEYVRGKNIKTIPEARKLLSSKITNEDLLDEVIVKLVDDDVLVIADASEGGYTPYYERAVAFIYKNTNEYKRGQLCNEMSFGLDWFTPSDADKFIDYCLRDGVIAEDDNGVIKPTFDISKIELPYDWNLNDELQIRTGSDIARERAEDKKHDSEIKFVMTEYKDDQAQALADDGFVIDQHEDIEFDGVEVRVGSDRHELRRDVVVDLVNTCNITSNLAYNLYDYYELNYGLVDEDMFTLTCVQHEGVKDDSTINKCYKLLSEVFS